MNRVKNSPVAVRTDRPRIDLENERGGGVDCHKVRGQVGHGDAIDAGKCIRDSGGEAVDDGGRATDRSARIEEGPDVGCDGKKNVLVVWNRIAERYGAAPRSFSEEHRAAYITEIPELAGGIAEQLWMDKGVLPPGRSPCIDALTGLREHVGRRQNTCVGRRGAK